MSSLSGQWTFEWRVGIKMIAALRRTGIYIGQEQLPEIGEIGEPGVAATAT